MEADYGQKHQAKAINVELNLTEDKATNMRLASIHDGHPVLLVSHRRANTRCLNIAQTRQALCNKSITINYASNLCQVFRAVITGTLDELNAVLEDAVTLVMEAIDALIACWFSQVLQLDPRTLRLKALEINAE